MKRATRHRKRTAPPGPCGILWQTQRGRGGKVSKLREGNHQRSTNEEELSVGEEENESLALCPNGNHGRNHDRNHGFRAPVDRKNKGNANEEDHDASTPPAWTAMQRSLGIVTPYLPIHTQGNVPKRYELLRPHLPPNCVLLSDLLRGKHDLTLKDPDLYLCVWVDSIDERNAHHGIWTVVLKDETGATIRAWMEPNFCKKELQKAQQQHQQQDTIDPEVVSPSTSNAGVVRTGVVWMLQNFSLTVIHHQNGNSNRSPKYNHNGGVERMLVVSGKHIARVWTPETDRSQHQPNEEDDSPEAQRRYLDWMEKRKALVVEVEDEGEDDDGGEEEEDERFQQNEYRESNSDHRSSEVGEHDKPSNEGGQCRNASSREYQQLPDSNSARLQTVGKSPSRMKEQRKNGDALNGSSCGSSDRQQYQRSDERIVGSTQQQERMTAMSALTMTANEDITETTQNTTATADAAVAATATATARSRVVLASSLETQPSLLLDHHQDVNIEKRSNYRTKSTGGEAASVRISPESLHPSNDRCNRNYNGEDRPSLPRLAEKSAMGRQQHNPRDTHPGQYDTQLATQRNSSQRNKSDGMQANPSSSESNTHRKRSRGKTVSKSGSERSMQSEPKQNKKKDRCNHPGVSPSGTIHQEHQESDRPNATGRQRKKAKSRTSPIRGKIMYPERSRGNHSPTRSPIRLPGSVWNTPDPLILEMLREEEANEALNEDDEVKTLVWDSSCPSCSYLSLERERHESKATCSEESKSNIAGGLERTEIAENDESQMKVGKGDDNYGNESPPAGRILLSRGVAAALFEPSTWVGVDATVFGDDEEDDES